MMATHDWCLRSMNKSLKIGIPAAIAIAVAAWLAFGFFGIHTAFIDDKVSEANPFADVATSSTGAAASESAAVEQPADDATGTAATDRRASSPATESSDNPAPAAAADAAVDAETDAASEAADATPEIVTLASGTIIDHDHSGEGTVTVLTDGTQRFLRFEDDFAIDNGPDLNVYLVRGVDAAGPASLFDDDFIDLGDLKGNIGAQNYELDPSIDLNEYDTVVIWCVRFSVAFNAADLN